MAPHRVGAAPRTQHDAAGPIQQLAGPAPETAPGAGEHIDPGFGDVVAAARLGTSGSGVRLPHLATIQRSFGKHDVSAVIAHTDAAASSGARAMGAAAFTTNDHVAFAGTASLHTAAHEAAHVVQQRAGVDLPAGVGQVGDAHERHADEVADRVAAGRSAEDLLDRYTRSAARPAAVQRRCAVCGGDDTPCAACRGESGPDAGTPGAATRDVPRPLVQRQLAPNAATDPPGPAGANAATDTARSAGAQAAVSDDSGPLRPRSDFYVFRGVQMTTDPAYMLGELRRLIRRVGLFGGDLWFDALRGRGFDIDLPFSAHARGYGGLRVRNPLDAQRDMQEEQRRNALAPAAVPLATALYPQIRKEAVDFLAAFQVTMSTTLETVLKESETRLGAERTRYGITRDAAGTVQAKDTVAFAGFVGAARDLREMRRPIDALQLQQAQLFKTRGKGGAYLPEANRPRYEALAAQIAELEKRYQHERTGAALRYPALGAILDDAGNTGQSWRLEQLAGGDIGGRPRGRFSGPPGTAEIIARVLDDRQSSIDTVRDKIKDDPGKLWNIAPIIKLSRTVMDTASRTMADKLIDEKLERLQFDAEIRNLLLGILAVVLAIPSGGGSLLAVGAATAGATLSAYQAMQSLQKYQLDLALANTDLDKRAYAIAAEEPSLFWVALDVAFAIADAKAAVGAFRSLKTEARAALEAAEGAEALAAETRLRTAADNAPGVTRPGLGEQLIEKLRSLRKQPRAARALGAGAGEAAAVTKASEAIAKEASSAKTLAHIAGHEVKVTRSGHLVICTECSWLRERFAPELAQDAKLLERLEHAEAEVKRLGVAVDVATTSEVEGIARELQATQKARVASQLGPEAAAALDKLHVEMDALRGGHAEELARNPALAAEIARIESIVDPAAKSAEMARARGLLSDARAARIAGPRTASGALDFHAWAARLKAEGVKGDIDAIIARARGTGADAAAARGELRAAERARLRGEQVEMLAPPAGPGAAQGKLTPEARITRGGSDASMEVKTATEPPERSSWNKHADKANKQIKDAGRQGEIQFDWTEVDVHGGDFKTQADIEAFLRGKMTNDRLREVRRFDIVWKDPAGHTLVTSRIRNVDGTVGAVTTDLL